MLSGDAACTFIISTSCGCVSEIEIDVILSARECACRDVGRGGVKKHYVEYSHHVEYSQRTKKLLAESDVHPCYFGSVSKTRPQTHRPFAQ